MQRSIPIDAVPSMPTCLDTPGVVDGPSPVEVAMQMLVAIRAVGGNLQEAFTAVASAFDEDVVWSVLVASVGEPKPAYVDRELLSAVCEAVGIVAPDMADRMVSRLMEDAMIGFGLEGWMCSTLANRPWLTALPRGVRCEGTLDLTGCPNLNQLGMDLSIGGDLCLQSCPSLTSLPRGLRIQGKLDLRGCTAWDGILPEDIVIRRGWIYTDRHPKGVDLDAWRKRHPSGEGRKEVAWA